MKRLLVTLGLLTSCSVWAQGDIEAGKQAAAVCAACHGNEGHSAVPLYPNLIGQNENYTKKQLHDFQLGLSSAGEQGRNDPIMSAMAAPLSEQDIENLAAYFASLTPVDGEVTQDIADKGHTLYNFGDKERGLAACSACHGAKGSGMNLANFPRLAGQHPEYIKAQLEKFKTMDRNNDLNAIMRDVAAKLTDEEIEIMAQYVTGLH